MPDKIETIGLVHRVRIGGETVSAFIGTNSNSVELLYVMLDSSDSKPAATIKEKMIDALMTAFTRKLEIRAEHFDSSAQILALTHETPPP